LFFFEFLSQVGTSFFSLVVSSFCCKEDRETALRFFLRSSFLSSLSLSLVLSLSHCALAQQSPKGESLAREKKGTREREALDPFFFFSTRKRKQNGPAGQAPVRLLDRHAVRGRAGVCNDGDDAAQGKIVVESVVEKGEPRRGASLTVKQACLSRRRRSVFLSLPMPSLCKAWALQGPSIVFRLRSIERGSRRCHIAAERSGGRHRECGREGPRTFDGGAFRRVLDSIVVVVARPKKSMRSLSRSPLSSSPSNSLFQNRTRAPCSRACSPATCPAEGWTRR